MTLYDLDTLALTVCPTAVDMWWLHHVDMGSVIAIPPRLPNMDAIATLPLAMMGLVASPSSRNPGAEVQQIALLNQTLKSTRWEALYLCGVHGQGFHSAIQHHDR